MATLLSFSMALRYSFDMGEDADLIEGAVEDVLASGLRTADIQEPGKPAVTTTAMADALIAALDKRTA